MKAQQVIYTSCKRGIERDSSGFQNYSYSRPVEEWIARGDSIGDVQSYEPPRRDGLPALPTTEEAQTLYPRRECFGKLEGPDGLYAMAMCSYIGRDYPEGSVRGGNFLSHALLMPVADVTEYPCTFIDSPSLMTWIDVERVRSGDKPDYLDAVDVQPNGWCSIDEVSRFLGEDDNEEAFKLMLRCLLEREKDGLTRRIIIKDSAQHFALWVAALEYALPLRQALDWGFSFYEYDLSRTSSDVIRAVDGMEQSLDEMEYDLVFDMERGTMPSLDDDVSSDGSSDASFEDADDSVASDFVDFVAETLQYVPDSLRDFHQYLSQTSYASAGRGIYSAFAAYELEKSMITFADCDARDLADCCAFLCEHGTHEQRHALFDILLAGLREQEISDGESRSVGGSLMALVEADAQLQSYARQAVHDVLVSQLTTPGISQRQYLQIHDLVPALPDGAGDGIDADVFASVTDDPKLSLGTADDGSGNLPWTVSAYATLASGALKAELDRGIRFPQGASGEQMLSAFSPRSASAVTKLVDAIVGATDPAVGISIASELTRQWGAQSSLAFMLDLLILQRQPAAHQLCDYALRQIGDMFVAGDDGQRTAICRSLVAGGFAVHAFNYLKEAGNRAANDPLGYAHLLAVAFQALPGEFSPDYRQQLVDLCWGLCVKALPLSEQLRALEQLSRVSGVSPQWPATALYGLVPSIPVVEVERAQRDIQHVAQLCQYWSIQQPDRLQLALQQLNLCAIAEYAKKSDLTRARQCCAVVMQNGAALPLHALPDAERNRYLQKMASTLSGFVTRDGWFLRLQYGALPAEFINDFVYAVLFDVVQSRDVEASLLLFLIDSVHLRADDVPGLRLDMNKFADDVAGWMSNADMKSGALEKYLPGKDGKLNRHGEHLKETYETCTSNQFPVQDFQSLLNSSVLVQMRQHEDSHRGFFGSFAKRFGKK